mgnify:CR=1 FL=1
MGRGGGGGGHSSGGGHSHSRGSHGSSYSHGGGRGSSFGGGGGGSFHSGPSYHGSSYRRPYYRSPGTGGHGPYIYNGGGCGGCLGSIVAVFLIVILFSIFLFFANGGNKDIAASTIPREPVESGNAYISDCVIDEIGWIDNETALSKDLKKFYEETGCQPYIILKSYDSTFEDLDACEEWSQQYYDTHFKENQNVVLYTYFCDRFDEGYGNDTLYLGTQSGLVFDSEAQEIFWDELDYYWDTWDTNDNDGMFAKVFTETADRIMTVTTTGADVAKTALIVVGVTAAGIIVIVLVTKKFKRDKEKAKETIDILNAPLGGSTKADDLADKYTKNGGN